MTLYCFVQKKDFANVKLSVLINISRNIICKCQRRQNEHKEKRLEKITYMNGPRQANLVLIAYASSEGSGEPAHPRSLARTSAALSYKQWAKRNLQTDPWPLSMAGHAQLKFVMTECSKAQIRLTRPECEMCALMHMSMTLYIYSRTLKTPHLDSNLNFC